MTADSPSPRPVTSWQWIISIVLLLGLFDLVLGLRAPVDSPAERETLARARQFAAAGHRTIVLIGDSVLAGDALARERPHDWDSQRVIDHMRRELARESDAKLEQIAFDGLLPIDALQLVVELDRLDPAGEVELLVEIDLRYFAAEYADQRDCSRPSVCELGRPAVRQRLLEWTPLYRHRAQLEDHEHTPRSFELPLGPLAPEHAQVEALLALLDRAGARGRKLSLFVTPLADGFARDSFEAGELGRHYAALAQMVNERKDPALALLDLDHPLFVDAHFLDHVHLGVEGSRLLALNLLRELNLPLAKRPFEEQIIHPEGHDRSLVHRVDSGYAEGGAWQALFDRPEGVAVSHDGTRIIVADTRNQVLRELRGNMQWVETVAGQPDQPGRLDGPARAARLEQPRNPELLGDAVWFIDGSRRDALRVYEGGLVRTPELLGDRCDAYQTLRARAAGEDRPAVIWALCTDGRLLHIDVGSGRARAFSDQPAKLVSFDLGPDAIYFADQNARLWRRTLRYADGQPWLGAWEKLFANTGPSLFPTGPKIGYPFAYNQVRLAKVADLRFVERYGGLLIADEFPLGRPNKRLARELTERVHLRYFDLGAKQILPWVKPVPHGEAHALQNSVAEQIVSYWHFGSMALVQDDASLVWLELHRSRLLRIADGLLGVAKTGNHHTRRITIPLLQTLSAGSRAVESQFRPDRFLDRRHEPLDRRGPYVALLFGSSLSSMSDRLSNYSLGRRLELELQRELGYRDLIRLDLFQVSWPSASFGANINNFANWMKTSVPPDVVFIEAHDFGGGEWYMRDTKTRAEVVARFDELRRLAARYDTLIVFYDLSSIESNRRDGMRATDKQTRELLEQAQALGFVVLDPGDRLFRELLRHSPWGNQPFDYNQHHGASWAVDLTAHTLAMMVYPILREWLRERVPARLRERPPAEFDDGQPLDSLRLALEQVPLERSKLAVVRPGYVQTNFVGGELRVYVDLAGFREPGTNLDELAVAVIDTVLREDIYVDLAETLRLELVEFGNYDEYGNGVLESATSKWKRSLDRKGLEQFLRKHRPR